MNESFAERTNEAEVERLRQLVAVYEARLAEAAELAAHVRHEVNNPLTGLMGQAQLLLRESLGETARRRVQTIEQLSERIRDTVAELRRLVPPDKEKDAAVNPSAEPTSDPPRH